MEGPDLVLPRLLWLRARLPRQGRMQAEQLIEDIEALAKRSPQRPLFLPGHLHLPLAGHLETVGRVMRELDSTRFEVVRPDELFQLARQWYDEHPIVTLPEELVVAEGLEQSLRAAVDNTTGRELTISFDAPGLRDRPVEAKVGARSEQAVLLRWDRVEGDAIELRVSYARQAETHRLVVRRLELPARVVEGATRAEVVRILDAVDMNHRFGQAESLPGTWAPRAFVARARPGEAQEGHIVFGGYEALDPGRYLVIYRLQSLAAGRGLVARLDVASGYGKTIAAARELGAQDLPVGRWTAVPLGFSADGVLEASECRVEWLGGGPLAVDRIYVLRLE